MFENIKTFLSKVRDRMFPKQTLKKIIGREIALSQSMIENIELWSDMLAGEAPWCEGEVKSLGLEQVIVQEFSNICLNEMEASVSHEGLDKIFQSAISDLNEELQDGIGLGSLIIKPLGADKVEYVPANRFIPIEIDSDGEPRQSAFMQVKQKGLDRYYIRFEFHILDGNGLTIKNVAYRSNNLYAIGGKIALEDEPEWANLAEEVHFPGVDRNIFGYYKNPKKNRVDGSKCGVSIFSDESAINSIKRADIQFARLDWEFESGERAVHADVTVLNPNIPGVAKLSKRLYKGVDLDADGKKLIDVFSPTFREESILNGFNAYLKRVEQSVSLAFGDISEVSDVAKTATEVLYSKVRKYDMVQAIEKKLKICLEGLVYGLAFHNRLTATGYEFICDFKDSVLSNEESELQEMKDDASSGFIRPEIYIAKKYGVTEKEALEMMPREVEPSVPPNPYGFE